MKKQSEIRINYFNESCKIVMGHYQSHKKKLAMILEIIKGKNKGMDMCTVSTNIDYPFAENEIAVNMDPLLDTLIENEILIDTSKRGYSGYNTYAICKINFEIDEDFVS